ncbi:MAG: hypothetical protein EOO85_33770, partial [Pedobacter sp.]
MNYTQTNGGQNFLAIVAVDDNTHLIVHPNTGVSDIPVYLAKAGDVYQYMSGSSDLTGTYIETDKSQSACGRFAVFSGSSVIGISCFDSQDPLYQQLYPTASWGKKYGVVPFKDRRYILRILAQEDNTIVNINGSAITLNKGRFYESGNLSQSVFVSADKLISEALYSLTQSCSSISGGRAIGDPEMVLLNPIEFNIKTITVFSSTLQNILERYINVLMLSSKTSSFK